MFSILMPKPADSPEPVPDFTPVPVRPRRDGWSPERQRAFLAALASTRCVDRSARAVGLSRVSAYRLRRHPQAGSFATAWDEILAWRPPCVTRSSLLWERAMIGTVKPIVRRGKVVGHVHAFDNKAGMTLLLRMDQADRASARMRARYGLEPDPW
jgi:hypothetical protein